MKEMKYKMYINQIYIRLMIYYVPNQIEFNGRIDNEKN